MPNDSQTSITGDIPSLLSVVSSLPLFSELSSELQGCIAEEIEWFALPGGTTLFEAGDDADAVYFVITGCLGAFAADQNQGGRRLLGHIVAGETVGEMALISGHPLNATIIALRDSELGRWPKQGFDALMQNHPRELLHITRLIVQRLENSQRLQRRSAHRLEDLCRGPAKSGSGWRRLCHPTGQLPATLWAHRSDPAS
ncbi:MAG: cyclic nucleotide-binding domain-containing protein [Gammaproteobacteria bacterium]|nr:cyclic nucleotide-binding domain-containing protein [Gammaproteobacteria bacterium]